MASPSPGKPGPYAPPNVVPGSPDTFPGTGSSSWILPVWTVPRPGEGPPRPTLAKSLPTFFRLNNKKRRDHV
eukprot:5699589-Pyramimonas_sp.AAC.1